MAYWIDRDALSDNVIVTNQSTIFVGFCHKDSCDQVKAQLEAGTSPLEVLGSDDLLTIPLTQVQALTSRNTDPGVDITYLANNKNTDKDLTFQDLEAKQSFMDELGQAIPEHLAHSEYAQTAFAASLSPLFSLLLAGLTSWLFFSNWPWLTGIFGGIWILASIYTLQLRAKNPPVITRWSLSGRPIRRAWNGIKTGITYLFWVLIVLIVYATYG